MACICSVLFDAISRLAGLMLHCLVKLLLLSTLREVRKLVFPCVHEPHRLKNLMQGLQQQQLDIGCTGFYPVLLDCVQGTSSSCAAAS